MHKTVDVFGISRDIPLNYVIRKSADNILVENLTRDKHLVIFGSSKQGKTSLRKHVIDESDYIVVHCSNKWSVSDINSSILKKAGFELTQSTSKATSGKSKIFAKITAGIFGNSAEGGAEAEREKREEIIKTPLELDPEDVNDIIQALRTIKFNKYIVLEDFHYLSTETQKDFSVALKAYHEESKFCFIIIGVWLEENRLTVYNGDLSGRVISINADKWETNELKEVITLGENLLNIKFSEEFINELISDCYGSVYIVQETCYRCCVKYEINSKLSEKITIGTSSDARELVGEVVNQQTGRFNSFINQFSDGFQTTTLEMYKWLLFPILTSSIEDLRKGLRYSEITRILRENHPEKSQLNPGNITRLFSRVLHCKSKKTLSQL
jgi:hypothetical protein